MHNSPPHGDPLALRAREKRMPNPPLRLRPVVLITDVRRLVSWVITLGMVHKRESTAPERAQLGPTQQGKHTTVRHHRGPVCNVVCVGRIPIRLPRSHNRETGQRHREVNVLPKHTPGTPSLTGWRLAPLGRSTIANRTKR